MKMMRNGKKKKKGKEKFACLDEPVIDRQTKRQRQARVDRSFSTNEKTSYKGYQ